MPAGESRGAPPSPRGGHVMAEAASRARKAAKIESLIRARTRLESADLLDLGAGAGHISRHFADKARSVTAVDRDISAFAPGDIPVFETPGATLPFDAASFDVVIYNHVIEHVGDRAEQAAHLAEIRRVLRPGGWLYLAVPSRWALIEPHYRLPFLSWLPARAANALLRALGRNDWYDCLPFGHGELLRFMARAGFETTDATAEAMRHFARHEASGPAARLIAGAPEAALRALAPLMPTFVVVARVA